MTRKSVVVYVDGKSIFFRKLSKARDFVENKVSGAFEMVWRYETRTIGLDGEVFYQRQEWPVRDADKGNIYV